MDYVEILLVFVRAREFWCLLGEAIAPKEHASGFDNTQSDGIRESGRPKIVMNVKNTMRKMMYYGL